MTYFVFKGSVVALNSIPANEAEENKRFLASPPPLTGLLWLTVAVTNYSLLAVTRMYKATKSYLDLGLKYCMKYCINLYYQILYHYLSNITQANTFTATLSSNKRRPHLLN